jgi:DUF971 family protein
MKITQFILNKARKTLTLHFAVESSTELKTLTFDYEYLRVFCPVQYSAKQKASGALPEVFHKKEVLLLSIEPLGKHGHRLTFDDKHSAIYVNEDFEQLHLEHSKNWPKYIATLTAVQNREASIQFKAL